MQFIGESNMVNNIVITGATGFLGRNLAEELHRDGLRVVASGRSISIGNELTKTGVEFRYADIRDPEQLDGAFSGAECVIHCAGKSGPWGKYRDFYDHNVTGTRNVVHACIKSNIEKIISISTPSVYFTGKERSNVSEDDPLPRRQMTSYSRTKIIAELELEKAQDMGLKVIMFRPRALYGAYENTFTPRILRMAEKPRLPLINDGKALIDITYVGNFVDAVRNCLRAPHEAWNHVYNISNGDPIRVRDWFAQFLEVFGLPFKPKNVPELQATVMAGVLEFVGGLPFVDREPRITRFSVAYLAQSMTMSIEKARLKLDYEPRVGNREGFERYAQWCRERRIS
jgi:nucleoside-diphosphate-sugar epimerase